MLNAGIILAGQPPSANAFTGLQDAQQYRGNALAMDAQRQGMQQQEAQFNRQAAVDLASGVLSVPSAQRPQAYKAALQEVGRQGGNIQDLPSEYSEDVDLMLRMYVGGEQESTGFLRELQAAGIDPASEQGRDLLLSRYGALDDGPGPTTGMREYEFARQQGFEGSFVQWKEVNRSQGMELTSDGKGGFTLTQGGGSGRKTQKLNERQSMLTLFGSQMEKMAPVLDDLELRFDPANVGDAAATAAGTFGNFVRSEEKQLYDATAAAWAEGVLRIQTGAAAQDSEIARVVRTYFAVPGDTPKTILHKRAMREGFFESVVAASGGTFQKGDSEPLGRTKPDVSQISDEELMKALDR